MKDMIAKIIDMDQKARDISAEAQKSKVDVAQEVAEIKEKIREDYLARARERIKKNQKIEKKAADEEWELISKKHKKIIEDLDKTYSEKRDEWINTIVKRVIEE